jgi:hypothetical protein
MPKRVATFKALGSNGREYVLEVYKDLSKSKNINVGSFPVAGITIKMQSNREEVIRIENGKYKFESINGDLILTSDSPDAP